MIRPIQKRKRDALNFGFRSLSFGNDSNTEKNVAGDKHGVPSSERDLADHKCSARWRTLAFTNNSEQLKPLHFVQARAFATLPNRPCDACKARALPSTHKRAMDRHQSNAQWTPSGQWAGQHNEWIVGERRNRPSEDRLFSLVRFVH